MHGQTVQPNPMKKCFKTRPWEVDQGSFETKVWRNKLDLVKFSVIFLILLILPMHVAFSWVHFHLVFSPHFAKSLVFPTTSMPELHRSRQWVSEVTKGSRWHTTPPFSGGSKGGQRLSAAKSELAKYYKIKMTKLYHLFNFYTHGYTLACQ